MLIHPTAQTVLMNVALSDPVAVYQTQQTLPKLQILQLPPQTNVVFQAKEHVMGITLSPVSAMEEACIGMMEKIVVLQICPDATVQMVTVSFPLPLPRHQIQVSARP
jgi:hypothetical protein